MIDDGGRDALIPLSTRRGLHPGGVPSAPVLSPKAHEPAKAGSCALDNVLRRCLQKGTCKVLARTPRKGSSDAERYESVTKRYAVLHNVMNRGEPQALFLGTCCFLTPNREAPGTK